MTSTLRPGGPSDRATEVMAPVRRTLGIARSRAGRLTAATVLAAATLVAGIALMAMSGWLISRAAEQPSVTALTVAIVGVRFFALTRGLFRYGERLVGHDAAFRTLADLRVQAYRRLERLVPGGLPGYHRGDLLGRIVGDVDALADVPLRVIPPWGAAALVGAATVGVVAVILPSAALVLAVSLLLAGVAVPILTHRLARRSEAGRAGANGQLAKDVVDLLEGAPDLVAYGAMDAQLARLEATDAELARVSAAASCTAGAGSGLQALCSGLAVWGSAVVGVAAVSSGELSGVFLAVVVLVPLAAFESVAGLPGATQALERVRRSAARVFEVFDAPPPVHEPDRPAPLPGHVGELQVRGLRVQRAQGGPWVLDGVALDLRRGRHVAVVGPSGAGKTTLADVLVRFVDYQGGSVRLDGVELDTLAGEDVRRAVGLVEQGAHLFDASIRENLLIGRPGGTDDDLREALAQVRLLDWVDGLPRGLATAVGEHGAAVSGGQRQRLAIARALLARFPILVVDEPAEHLDTASGDALIDDLVALPTTLLLITHRLTGLEQMDEIVVLDGGTIVARGTHDELVDIEGPYARLWRREREGELV